MTTSARRSRATAVAARATAVFGCRARGRCGAEAMSSTELVRGRIGEVVERLDGVPKVAWRVRLLERPQRPRDAARRDTAEPARARADPLDRHRGGARAARGARGARRTPTCRARRPTDSSSPTSPSSRSTACATTASPSRSWPRSRSSRPAASGGDRRRVRAPARRGRHDARDRDAAAAPRPPDDGARLPRRPAPQRRALRRDQARRSGHAR